MAKKKGRIIIWGKHHKIVVAACALVLLSGTLTIVTAAFWEAPRAVYADHIAVEPNASIDEIVEKIHGEGYGTSKIFLKITLTIASFFKKIEAGGYYLTRAMNDWEIFRSLANPGMRYVKIAAGQRKEEIADVVADRLDWDTIEKREFINVHMNFDEENQEGKYFPDSYLLPIHADPKEVGQEMFENFEETLDKLKKKYPKNVVNPDTALLIASIIQREAAGKQDMRLISGIIWNRIFRGMSLSMDATIQYARGKTEEGWWSPIEAADIREIESPYNTYKNEGLPPTPISNPGIDALEAALNPQKTSCLYYIHDDYRRIHCSSTGEGHEANIRAYLR